MVPVARGGRKDWNNIVTWTNAGIQEDFMMNMDWDSGWYKAVQDYGTWPNWTQMALWVYGMADKGGDYAEWLTLDLGSKGHHFADGRPVLIVTDDLRFPQGTTVAEQRANAGTYHTIMSESWEGIPGRSPSVAYGGGPGTRTPACWTTGGTPCSTSPSIGWLSWTT